MDSFAQKGYSPLMVAVLHHQPTLVIGEDGKPQKEAFDPNDLQPIKAALESCDPHVRNSKDETAFILAVKINSGPVTRWFLEKNLHQPDEIHNCMILCGKYGLLGPLEALLDHGGDINTIEKGLSILEMIQLKKIQLVSTRPTERTHSTFNISPKDLQKMEDLLIAKGVEICNPDLTRQSEEHRVREQGETLRFQ